MKNFLKRAAPYLITATVGIIIFVIVICTKSIWNESETHKIMSTLSDACFVPGVLLAGAGLIVFASNGGAFDMLSFAVIRFFDLFRKDCKNSKYKDFYEYREAKKDRKRGMAFMLIVGAVFIAFAGIFLLVYYQTLPQTNG